MLTKPGARPHCGAKAALAPCDFHVFGEIEVVAARGARHFGDTLVTVIGKSRDDGGRLVRGDVVLEKCRIRGVEVAGLDQLVAVRGGDVRRRAGTAVSEVHLVIAAPGEQPGDERADLAGSENEHAMHGKTPWILLLACIVPANPRMAQLAP